jgi:integrase
MYLQRNCFGVYCTRIPLTKSARDNGFPHTVRLSLKTKCRKTASERNAVVSIHVFEFLKRESSFSSREVFDRDLKALRSALHGFFEGTVAFLPSDSVRSENQSFSLFEKKAAPADTTTKPSPYRDFAWLIRAYMSYKKKTAVTKKYIQQVEGRLAPLRGFFNARNPRTLKLTDGMRYQQHLVENQWRPKTVKEYMSVARQLCDWCVRMEYLRRNPFDGVKPILSEKKAAHEQREIWTASQLEALLAQTSFSTRGSLDDMWIPLIILHTGLRPGEVCQLRVTDVHQCEETAIWYFHISDDGPKQKIKTPNARRDVPINQALLDRGFLDYFRRRKQDRKTQLFNCTATGKDDDWSRNFTQRFNRFLANRLGYESGNRPGAYSLRHTFINALKQSDRPEHVVADIVGHSKRAITFDRYGKPAGLAKKAAVINSVNFL